MSVDKITMDGQYETEDRQSVRVLCVDRPDTSYPVVCLVGASASPECYTADGYYFSGKSSDPRNLRKVSPWKDFQLDELVVVGNVEGMSWELQHFAGEKDGKALTWVNGMTSKTALRILEPWAAVSSWKYCRRPAEDELRAGLNNETAFQDWLKS